MKKEIILALETRLPNMKLRALIKLARKSTKSLSLDLGHDASYLSRVITGERKLNKDTIFDLSHRLDIPIKTNDVDIKAKANVVKAISLLSDYELELLNAAMQSNIVRTRKKIC